MGTKRPELPRVTPHTVLAADLSRRELLRRGILTVGAMSAIGILAACDTDDDDDESAAPETESEDDEDVDEAAADEDPDTDDEADEEEEPEEDDSSGDFDPPVAVMPVGPETLDPHFGESSPMGMVLGNVMEPLMSYDRDMNMAPALAESWEVQDDQLTWRFELRDNVLFQNGEPFTAEAVKFTVERTMDEALRDQGLNDPFPDRTGIESVEVIDDLTVEMTLAEPNIVLPVFVTFLYILEPGYYSSTEIDETARNPLGTGPYQFVEWVSGDHITLERFPDYWRGEPPVPSIVFRPIPERATRLSMLQTGEADIVGDLTPDDFPLLEGVDHVRISDAPGARRSHIGIPANIPRYQDREVRHALQMAMDMQGISDSLLGPMAPEERRPTVLVSSVEWENPDIPLVEYDPDQARANLEDAGFDFDQEIRVISPEGRYLKDTEVAQAVAGNLRDIGLNAEAEIIAWEVYTERMRSDDGIGDIYLLSLGSRFHGPEDLSIVTTGQIWDQTQWIENTENGPVFQEMYEELTQTFDEDEQLRIVHEMLMLFHEEYVWVPLWVQPAATGVNERLTFEDSGGGNRLNFWLPDDEPVRVTS